MIVARVVIPGGSAGVLASCSQITLNRAQPAALPAAEPQLAGLNDQLPDPILRTAG